MVRCYAVLFSVAIALGATGPAAGGQAEPHPAEPEYRAAVQAIEAEATTKVEEIQRNMRAQYAELQTYMDRGMKGLEGKTEQEMKQGLQALQAEVTKRRETLEKDSAAAMERLNQEMMKRVEQEMDRIRKKYGIQ